MTVCNQPDNRELHSYAVRDITQCYLPPSRGDISPSLSQLTWAATGFSDPEGMQCKDDLTSLADYMSTLYIRAKMVTHLITNRARRRVTLLTRLTTLPLRQTANQ